MTSLKKLCKARFSIRNFVNRGGTLNARRGQVLVDRYNQLKSELVRDDRRQWVIYCCEIGADPSHDGYDFFA